GAAAFPPIATSRNAAHEKPRTDPFLAIFACLPCLLASLPKRLGATVQARKLASNNLDADPRRGGRRPPSALPARRPSHTSLHVELRDSAAELRWRSHASRRRVC